MKILVIYATAGAGHRKAAEAIYNVLCSAPGHEVALVDGLDYTNRFYKYLYSQSYTFLITRLPGLWGLVFGLADLPLLRPAVRFCRRVNNALFARRLAAFLRRENFDIIFSTHFFPNEVAAYLKKRKAIASRIICSVTDYDVHSIWPAAGIDYYTVATEKTRERLLALGVAAERIAVTGIPVDEKFSGPQDTKEIRGRLGLKEGIPTVLVATGSFGIGPIAGLTERIAGWQTIVVSGHNKSLYEQLARKPLESRKVLGLVNNMHELMAVSDCMVTKPGGLSISEALAVGLGLVFFNAIPGQETNNVRILKEYGAGDYGATVGEIVCILERFRSRPEELAAARQQSRALGRPFAAREIVSLMLKLNC